MSSVVISGDTSGAITVSAPAVAGTNTLTLLAATATNSVNVLSTAVASTLGTSISFTDLPAWVKRITVMLQGVSLSSTAQILVQLGTGATPTYTITGYLSSSGGVAASTGVSNVTSGFNVRTDSAAQIVSGIMTIVNITDNSWVSSHSAKQSASTVILGGGDVSLGAVLTAVRITSTSTDTFDLGTINILYEG